VLAAIAGDPELTMGQKQSLSQIYETFRNENARTRPPADDDTAGGNATLTEPKPTPISEETA
jgi:hypothetical protein